MSKKNTINIPGIGEVSLTKDGWPNKRQLKKPLRDAVDKMKKESDEINISQQKDALIEILKKLNQESK